MRHRLDLIGDIHGELPALENLGRELGYAVADGWRHPEGRLPIFLGDLVDRGAHSFEVASLVRELDLRGRALCLMGNHEYNLVAWSLGVPGYERPKKSNSTTIAEIERQRDAWQPLLAWMRDLPLALDLPDLRVIHACWHVPSLDLVTPHLEAPRRPPTEGGTAAWVRSHVALRSPFEGGSLVAGLPGDTADHDAIIPHEDLIKGFELPAEKPFRDNDGKLRTRVRATWWSSARELVLTDKPQVFGHYWNVPPVEGQFAPPHPSGHPDLRAWCDPLAKVCPETGSVPLEGDFACVDFNGVTNARADLACVGALRWPEREVVWAMGPKTATTTPGASD